jgi:ATP-dependent DNA ligase
VHRSSRDYLIAGAGLFTRRGHDWTARYPAIAAAAARLRARSFTLDGEAVVCGVYVRRAVTVMDFADRTD